jgi:uncharacterized membrane protein
VTTADALDLPPVLDADDLPDDEAPAGPSERSLGWQLLVLGGIALAAAFVLVVERIQLLIDPEYVPSCSLNPVLSCGSVMVTEQASVFGIPNPLIGVLALPVVVTTGAALLAGARMARWYWVGLQAGVLFGLVAVSWLVFQSLYRIGALCPYCMVVWAGVVPLVVSVTAYNLARGNLWRSSPGSAWVQDLVALRWWIVGFAFAVVIGLIGVEFWSYWQTLLP